MSVATKKVSKEFTHAEARCLGPAGVTQEMLNIQREFYDAVTKEFPDMTVNLNGFKQAIPTGKRYTVVCEVVKED